MNQIIEPVAAEGIGMNGDTTEKKWTFRRLNSRDAFLMFKIISKIGINEFTSCFEKDSVKQMIADISSGEGGDIASVVGMSVVLEIANVIFGNVPKCEKEIFQMLSDTSNLSVKAVENLDMVEFFEMVVDFIQKDEFKDFMRVVSRLLKSAK